VIEQGVKEIEKIEDVLIAGDRYVMEDKKYRQTFSATIDLLSAESGGGVDSYGVEVQRRQKSLRSFFRKIVVRDQLNVKQADDTFAEAYIVKDSGPHALEEAVFFPTGEIRRVGQKEKLFRFKAPRFVGELMYNLLEAAKREQPQALVRIFDYKELLDWQNSFGQI
jgi:hypothetical protein